MRSTLGLCPFPALAHFARRRSPRLGALSAVPWGPARRAGTGEVTQHRPHVEGDGHEWSSDPGEAGRGVRPAPRVSRPPHVRAVVPPPLRNHVPVWQVWVLRPCLCSLVPRGRAQSLASLAAGVFLFSRRRGVCSQLRAGLGQRGATNPGRSLLEDLALMSGDSRPALGTGTGQHGCNAFSP